MCNECGLEARGGSGDDGPSGRREKAEEVSANQSGERRILNARLGTSEFVSADVLWPGYAKNVNLVKDSQETSLFQK